MAGYLRFVLRYRVWVLGAIAAITLAAGLMLTQAVVASSAKKLFFGGSEAFARYIELTKEFASDEVVAIAIQDPAITTPGGIARLRKAVAGIERVPEVRRVDSLLTAQRLRAGPDGALEITPYAKLLEEHPASAAEFVAEIQTDPLYRGLLLAPAGEATLVSAELHAADRAAESEPAMAAAIRQAVIDAGFAPPAVHLAGVVVATAECVDMAYFTLRFITPFVLIVLLVVVHVLFGRFWPVFVTGLVALIGVIWAMGFAVLLDRQVNILLAMAPGVMLVVAFSDVIHLCNAYVLLISTGKPKMEAIMESGTEVGFACFLTSLTTFLGFVSFILVPTPVFRQLGVVLSTGVALALVIALTLVPILFSLMPEPKPFKSASGLAPLALIDRALEWCLRAAISRPWHVIGWSAAATAICIYFAMGVEIETNFSKRLPEDHRLPRAERFIRDHFSGTNILDIILDAGEPSALLDPAVFAKTRAVQQNLATVPGVDTAFSAVNLIERMHRELAPEEAARASLPGSRELLAQYQLLFEMSGGEGFQRLINDENRRMRIALRLQGSGFRESAEIGRAAVAAANQAGGPVLKAEPAGLTYLFGGWLDFIVAGQRQGLAFSIVTIALVMAWGLRSFAAGMWSMVPNLIPLMFLGGYVATRYGQVDSDTLIVAIMAIGIAVDDTIHILTRLQFERQRHENLEDALKRAYLFCGRGMVMTTVILSLGFSPFYFSDYYSTQILGTLLPLTLIVALVADLLLTPAMAAAKIINIKGKSINSQAGPEKEPLR